LKLLHLKKRARLAHLLLASPLQIAQILNTDLFVLTKFAKKTNVSSTLTAQQQLENANGEYVKETKRPDSKNAEKKLAAKLTKIATTKMYVPKISAYFHTENASTRRDVTMTTHVPLIFVNHLLMESLTLVTTKLSLALINQN